MPKCGDPVSITYLYGRATNGTLTLEFDLLKNIPCVQVHYLVNGEMRSWDGPRQTVFSPVWKNSPTDDAKTGPLLIYGRHIPS